MVGYSRRSLSDLQNKRIVIKDYEKDVKTKNGLRYLVLFDDKDTEGKFYTNSEELKQMLDQISLIDDGFPFSTTIKRIPFSNGKYKYSFT